MKLRSENPYWSLRSGFLHVFPPLEADVKCDAVIVGGGITGAVVADALVRAGVDCVLLDRRDIAQGSTSASTALLQYEIDTPLHQLIPQVGRRHAERAYQLGVEAIHHLATLARAHDCAFAYRPSLLLARHRQHLPLLTAELAARQAAGLDVHWVTAEELARTHRLQRPAGLRSAIAAEVDPYRLTHHLLAHHVRTGGLRVFDRTRMTGYLAGPRSVQLTTDRGPRVTARRVFFASGYETKTMMPPHLVQLRTTYAVISEPLPDLSWWHQRTLLWETGDPYLYARTTSDQRLLVGGEDDRLRPSHCYQALARKTATLQRKFQRLTGRTFEPAFSWSGLFGSTQDGLAYIGEHRDFPRALFALGFGGNGITFSVIASTLVRDLFLGRRNPDAPIFAFNR